MSVLDKTVEESIDRLGAVATLRYHQLMLILEIVNARLAACPKWSEGELDTLSAIVEATK